MPRRFKPTGIFYKTKKHAHGVSFCWWTIRGLSPALKENLRFSEPFQGFSSLVHFKQKTRSRRVFLLVDDQGLEPWAH